MDNQYYMRIKTDKDFAIQEHRKMWHWLADNPTKDKFDYCDIMGILSNEIVCTCFLCHFTDANDMPCCLLEWVDGDNKACPPNGGCTSVEYEEYEGLYTLWRLSNCKSLQTKYANMIAELKEVDKEYESKNKIFKSERY